LHGRIFPFNINKLPIDAGSAHWFGATAFMLARLDKPLRPAGAAKTAKAKTGEDDRLQSLVRVSCGSTCPRREAMLAETISAA
jgi:hypothetical protein